MTEAFWSGILGSLIGGLAAIAGGFASSWQARKQLDRQLEHSEHIRIAEARTAAYSAFIVAADAATIAGQAVNTLAPSVRHARTLRKAGSKLGATAQHAALIAPRETATLIHKLTSKVLQVTKHPEDEAHLNAVHQLRHEIVVSARRDIGSEPGVAAPLPDPTRLIY